MAILKYGQIPAASKEFNNHDEVTDLTNNDLNHNMIRDNLVQWPSLLMAMIIYYGPFTIKMYGMWLNLFFFKEPRRKGPVRSVKCLNGEDFKKRNKDKFLW